MVESTDEGGNVSIEEGSEEEGAADKLQAGKLKEMSTLASAELLFPFKPIPLVIAGIPENYLPLCGPKTQSHYHCQFPQCNLDFAQKATACNHIWHNHLNLALAWLYCSLKDTPKMHWYSATAWKHHTMKHLKDNLPIFPNDPVFTEKFIPQSGGDAAPSTSKQMLSHKEEVRKQVQATKCFLEEQQTTRQVPTLGPLNPKREGLKLSSLGPQAPSMSHKHHVKHGPVKSSKNLKFTSKDVNK